MTERDTRTPSSETWNKWENRALIAAALILVPAYVSYHLLVSVEKQTPPANPEAVVTGFPSTLDGRRRAAIMQSTPIPALTP